MPRFNSLQNLTLIITTILIALAANQLFKSFNSTDTTTAATTIVQQEIQHDNHMSSALKQAAKTTMSTLKNAKIVHRPSSTRGHADHGWLNTYHSFSFANWYDPRYESFGSLRVLNEDRVAPGTGFPNHPHRDAEIFSYILSGELTHRDSMQKRGAESSDKNQFYRMKRGDVQFTTGGTGIAHSEQNEHDNDWVHFLQIWALPWKKGLKPAYHTSTFAEDQKRKGFVNIISPLKAGKDASATDENEAIPTIAGTIPVHADLVFSAGIIPTTSVFDYTVGSNAAISKLGRQIYVHLPMTKGGKASIKIDGRENAILKEGDGAFISNVNAGDVLTFESVGNEEAEVVILDSN